MTVNEVMEKMIVASNGSFHDINHFLRSGLTQGI